MRFSIEKLRSVALDDLMLPAALGPFEGDHRESTVLLICAQGPQLALPIFIEPCDSSPEPCEEIRPALERLWLSALHHRRPRAVGACDVTIMYPVIHPHLRKLK